MTDIEDKVKLRVYHRTPSDIVLLWSSETLSTDQKEHIKLLCEGKPMEFGTTEHLDGSRAGIAQNTVICMVKHEPNGLRPDAKYNLQLILGGVNSEPLVRKITVLEYGVLPAFEKDRKSARVHNMLWSPEAGTWVKFPVVRLANGTYAIPTVMVDSAGKLVDND